LPLPKLKLFLVDLTNHIFRLMVIY